MDRARAALTVERLLGIGLAVTTERTETGYMCRITGNTKPVSGVAETLLEALARASWRWTLN
jgi:hypothetical protein